MPEYPTSEPIEAILSSLGPALDLANVGILLLNGDLHVRFANRRVTELFGLPPALLTSRPTFRDLLDHVGASGLIAVQDEKLAEYLDQRDAAVRAKVQSRRRRFPYEMDGACCFAAAHAGGKGLNVYRYLARVAA